MLPCGCKPDGMTYGILISAYDKGNQWCLALQVLSALPPAIPVTWTLLHVYVCASLDTPRRGKLQRNAGVLRGL